jgi:peptidoglycan/xylan/chitin deacetylase (PgdA/CDA1 family)
MRRVGLVLLAALSVVPLAAASTTLPEPHTRPHVPSQWEQHRAVALAARRGAPVYCGGGHSDAVALTFDDGPSPYTDTVIRTLREHGAHATFFLVGTRIQYWPEAPREETTVGVIGNHTWSHPRLTDLPPWLVWLELVRTQYETSRELGWKPRLFRAPYELHSPTVDRIARSLGMLEVFWSVDSQDSRLGVKEKTVVRNVVAALRPGAIVLLHDIHPWTVAALPQILEAMRLRGLRAVSVPELLALDPPAAGQHCPFAPGVD